MKRIVIGSVVAVCVMLVAGIMAAMQENGKVPDGIENAIAYSVASFVILDGLFRRYGYFIEGVKNIYMKGLDGKKKMDALMERLRIDPPAFIGGRRVVSVRDYLKGTVRSIDTGEVTGTGLPKSNVLYFEVDNGDRIIIRPSGTEPKIKLYMLTSAPEHSDAEKQCALYMNDTDSFVD